MQWHIVGLGNPGAEYSFTRHNVGFYVLDYIQKLYHSTDWKKVLLSKTTVTTADILEHSVKLIKPLTYMNLSGKPLLRHIKKHEIPYLIVIHDDIHIPQGAFKISFGKNDGGHNGITSIIESLHTKDFIRIRVGIAPKSPTQVKLDTYVLEKMTGDERVLLEQTCSSICKSIEKILQEGLPAAMNANN